MLRMFILLCSCLALISPNLNAQSNSTSCEGHLCLAVVDVGSTGSRLHIYSYDTDSNNSPLNITELWNKKVKPGFATLEMNKATIDAYLANLMADAPVQNVPVYFYATAGMRLLAAPKQKFYYDEVQSWFSQQSQWKLAEAKTISGTDEAVYDWLSVNYQLGSLNSDQTPATGVMDMGGASVQIAFPITNRDTSIKDASHQTQVDIYGKHYLLSTYSFLGLGQTEMSHQFLNAASCFSNDYPMPDGETGTGDNQSCANEVTALINSVHGVNTTIQPLLETNHVDSWYVIGGLASIAVTKPIHFDTNHFTMDQLVSQAQTKLCQPSWNELNAQFPNDEYIYGNCLASGYYYALIVNGYGLTADQNINIFPADQAIDWTKGVVLHH